MNYQGKHVLVVGLGESGLAMARWLLRCGAAVRVADTRHEPERLSALYALNGAAEQVEQVEQVVQVVQAVQFVAGPFNAALLDGIDCVAVSPGLVPGRELAVIERAAAEKNIVIWGEIELFAQALARLKAERNYAPQLIAITGTNGKTTVTSLVGLLCRRAGLAVQVAGNISPAALDVLCEVLDQNTLPQVWVLELSSFQLHTTYTLQADAATVLNITQDHLDWHGDMQAYVSDKRRIFGAHTVRVLNRDDACVMQMVASPADTITFGADEPLQANSFGLHSERSVQWLAVAVAVAADSTEKKRRRNVAGDDPAPALIQRLMPVDALKIRGQHNAVNALAALALCRAIGLPLAPLLHGLRDYPGEPHRVELVATIGGVQYFDDSKGTNVGATAAALMGLGASQDRRCLLLIAGGDGKGQDFRPLIKPVNRYVRTVLLIGKDADAIRAVLQAAEVELLDCPTLDHAVQRAAELAHAGEMVLLSPACASLDMFENYIHRAQVFIDAVREIALQRGEVAQ